MNRNVWVYDIETLKSCFTYTAINIDSEEIVKYVIHRERNDYSELIEHLNECKGQIGFNNLNFDYPIIHYMMNLYWKLIRNAKHSFLYDESEQEIIELIYSKAQEIINAQEIYGSFYKNIAIRHSEVKIPQLDLYKIWHFNNAARATSLKALQIAINYPNVMESEVSHTKEDITLEEVDKILEYNLNDVLSTYEFYKKSLDKIQLRKDIRKTYGLPCANFSDVKIGETLLLSLYSELTDQFDHDVKKGRTYRDSINLNECIFPYIKFESKEFNALLTKLKSTVIVNTKGDFSESVIYKGFKYDFGTGGIHGCIKPGVYTSDDEYVIIDADVTSLYPSIAVLNRLYPQHLGEGFVDVYNNILNQRKQAKKEGKMSISDALKLSLNGAYGKSNSEDSFLYDPKFTMSITLNGQLMLAMLAERLVDNIPDITILQINTDGITVKLPITGYGLMIERYYEICKKWEEDTKLELEYVEYSKMIIRDVNNYIAVKTDGKCKYKGAFEIDKEYHKDPSFRIIRLALSDYFVKGIAVEETIKNHKNIYDFCGRQKFKSDSYGEIAWIDYDQSGNPYKQQQKQQRNVRYYISTGGSTFIKRYTKGTSEYINKGYTVTIFNKYKELPFDEYGINYSFYIKECYKEIEQIENKQLELFN